MQDREHGLGGDARRLLVASFRAPGIDQGKIYRLDFDQGGPLIRTGSLELEGFAGRLALDELLENRLARYDTGAVYVLTPAGAQRAAVESAEGE